MHKEPRMKSLIRNIVRDILLETRANLSIRPLMKQWVKIALDHGKNDTKALCAKLQGSIHENAQKTVGLRVPKNKSHLVFKGLTVETQEWVLKHWKTEEYFSNMISGVILGIVMSYGNGSNAIGQKSGETNIKSGTYNEADGTWVGGSDGYLTMKSNLHAVGRGSSMFLDVPDNNSITIFNVDSLKVNKNIFKQRCMKDLRQSDSVLYHEFQHWFQETVMFADERLKTPTKGSKGGTGYSVPKDFIDQKIPPKQVSMMILKQLVKGIDFLSPKEHPTLNIPMYEIQSMPSLTGSLFQYRDGNEDKVWPTDLYGKTFVKRGQSIDDNGWMKDFIENTLKIPLTPAGEELLYASLDPLYHISHTVHYGTKKEKRKYFRLNKSGELPKKQAESIRAAKMPVDIFFVPKSHMVKDKNKVFTGEIKPNKKLVAASTKQLSKDHMYIIFARSISWQGKGGYQSNTKKPSMIRNKIEKEKNPLYDDGNRVLSWDQRWIEFDAESRNYLAAAVDSLVKSTTHVFLKALVMSDDEKMTKLLVETIKMLLKDRIDRSITRQNEAELISMCSRIADKFVEEAEAMTLFDFQDNTPPGYKAPWRPSTEANVRAWLKGGNYFESRYADYWKYIKDRVFGEV